MTSRPPFLGVDVDSIVIVLLVAFGDKSDKCNLKKKQCD